MDLSGVKNGALVFSRLLGPGIQLAYQLFVGRSDYFSCGGTI